MHKKEAIVILYIFFQLAGIDYADTADDVKAAAESRNLILQTYIKNSESSGQTKQFYADLLALVKQPNINVMTELGEISKTYQEIRDQPYWDSIDGNASESLRGKIKAIIQLAGKLNFDSILLERLKIKYYRDANLIWADVDKVGVRTHSSLSLIAIYADKFGTAASLLASREITSYEPSKQKQIIDSFDEASKILCSAIINFEKDAAANRKQVESAFGESRDAKNSTSEASAKTELKVPVTPEEYYVAGLNYRRGDTVKIDKEKGLDYLRIAANRGHAGAQAMLGGYYFNGNSVTQSYEEALKWWSKSAESGNPVGQCGLGLLFFNGNGVKQDYMESIKWYRKAADQDYVWAYVFLGGMYRDGTGVTQDKAEALKWYRKAADRGNDTAIQSIETLEKSMGK